MNEKDRFYSQYSNANKNKCTSVADRNPGSKQIIKLNVNKPPGSDGLHPQVLRELSSVLATPLFLIFKDPILTGMVPND